MGFNVGNMCVMRDILERNPEPLERDSKSTSRNPNPHTIIVVPQAIQPVKTGSI